MSISSTARDRDGKRSSASAVRYVGRFAPSPTGPLHRGSLLAALASWLDARAAGGRWLVRIEDIDRFRCDAHHEAPILDALTALGLDWDGEVWRQSERLATYDAALETLLAAGQAFPCACVRKQLRAAAAASGSARYPGHCRDGVPDGTHPRSVRALIDPGAVRFDDRVLGPQRQDPGSEFGDFILRRGDGLHAYQLVVVVDDGEQGVTDIVRGADLLDSTGRQLRLQHMLGLPAPRYAHLPLLLDAAGRKLSKQTGAAPLDVRQPELLLRWALRMLGQPDCDGSRNEILEAAIAGWDPSRIPRQAVGVAPGDER